MKKSTLLPILTLAALPAFSQDQSLSLLATHIYTQTYSYSGTDFSTGNPTDLGLRYGRTLATFPKLGGARLDLEGTIVKACGKPTISFGGVSQPGVTYTHEYMALGASATWTKVVDFGAAVELRHETSTINLPDAYAHMMGVAEASYSTTRFRPWATARVGYTYPSGSIKPFVTLEYSLPLTTVDSPSNPNGFQAGGLKGPKANLTFTMGGRF
ncbi:MAG: hypothetical protein H6Q00_1002 [Holophagaceae bacterium]|nr:hypothetical protein [Holophagaceae bacterium]